MYRQAVLKKAFEGEFAIHKLGEIAVVSRGKSKHRPRNDKSLFGEKYPFIQTGEIRTANGGTFKKYSNTYSKKGLAQSKLWPKGTLCLTIAANIGETAFLGFDSCFPDSIVGIKPNNEVLSDKYLNFYIQKIKKDIDNKASATAQKNINVRFLNALEIPLPSLKYQKDIVREIESRLSICDKVEQSITEGLQKSEALRQSILKKAFEGKLLSEAEIEKCKQEADYEPASELLEKIKKEKKK
jgi:type I restriction enzyme S subunit